MISLFKIKDNSRKKISPSLLLLFFIFLLAAAPKISSACTSALETPDTNIVKYALNDPRNPDCPCHAAQKQADEEYARLQQQNNPDNNPADHNPVDNTDVNKNNTENANANSNSGSTGSGGSQKHYSSSNKTMKKMMKWSRKMKRQLGKKNNGTKKGKHRLASCFHF